MKKLQTIWLTIGMAAIGTACNVHGKHTTIAVNNDGDHLKIEYAGKVVFNASETAIESISPGGYVKYAHNDQKLKAENNGRGGIVYQINDGDTQSTLNANEQKILSEAVKEIIKRSRKQ